MLRLLFILIMNGIFLCAARGQSITVDDLMSLSAMPAKNFDNFLNKKGFVSTGGSIQYNSDAVTFVQKKSKKKKKAPVTVIRSVDILKKDNTYCFTLHTSSIEEFGAGKDRLKKGGFFYDKDKDTAAGASMLFQRKTIAVMSDSRTVDSTLEYSFSLQEKILPEPGEIQDAEDLTKFDSHECLASYFGDANVKRDVFFFDVNEIKKCSILFANTSRQAIFVWDDQGDMRKLAYVLISGISPTLSTARFTGNVTTNRWASRDGIFSSMSLRELLRANGADFEFYGANSEFAYMVSPEKTGKIDFKRSGVMLGCLDCSDSKLVTKSKVSAIDAVDKQLSLYVFYIMIRP